jgi:hypothetical protein
VLWWACQADEVFFLFERKGLGYIGFGFRPSADHGMVGSDMVMAGVTDEGPVFALDTMAFTTDMPTPDARQDMQNIRGVRSATNSTLVAFSRMRNTGDSADIAIVEGKMHVTWALGESNAFVQHVSHGVLDVELCAASPTESTAEASSSGSDTSSSSDAAIIVGCVIGALVLGVGVLLAIYMRRMVAGMVAQMDPQRVVLPLENKNIVKAMSSV